MLIIGSAIIMFTLDWLLALIAVIMVPLLLTVTLVFARRVRPRYLRTQRQFGEAMSVVQENLAGTRLVRAFGREKFEEAKFTAVRRNPIRRASLNRRASPPSPMPICRSSPASARC